MNDAELAAIYTIMIDLFKSLEQKYSLFRKGNWPYCSIEIENHTDGAEYKLLNEDWSQYNFSDVVKTLFDQLYVYLASEHDRLEDYE